VLRDLLGLVFKATDATPTYTPAHCLSVRGSGCRDCADVCPHEAIAIQRTVTIDPVDCTGCGLCVAACPSGALTPRGSVAKATTLRCSQVPGDAASVLCLARLGPADLATLGARDGHVTLAHGDCASCSVGDASVPTVVADAAARARALLSLHDRHLTIDVRRSERCDPPRDERSLSRRDLLRGGWRSVREGSSVLLSPLERLADSPERTATPTLPTEHARQLQLLELADLPDDAYVPLRLPAIDPGCILCPACTRICPTQALRRVFDGDAAGGARLELTADHCVDCGACVDACPVDVVRMRDDVTRGEIDDAPRVVYRAARNAPTPGVVARGGDGDQGGRGSS
jgi:ferredoxin